MVSAQRARAVALAMVVAAFTNTARAQLQPEARAEFVGVAGTRAEVGVGVSGRVGTYLRAGVSVTRDVWRSADTARAATRAEYLMRFTMDPIAEQRWGVSFGGGLGYRERVYLLAVAEVEGPARSGVRPAMQLALGGGTRAGFLIRRAVRGRR